MPDASLPIHAEIVPVVGRTFMTALFSADEEMTTREPPAFAQFDAACDFETAFEKYTYGGGLGGGKGGGNGGGDGGGGNGCSGGANGDGSL